MSKKMLAHRFLNLTLVLSLLVLIGLNVAPVQAAGTVNSCSRSALDAALAGGGTVTFGVNCTLSITSQIVIPPSGVGQDPTVIDGNGFRVVLDANYAARMFFVEAGGELTIRGLTLQEGRDTSWLQPLDPNSANDGGAIYNLGTLLVENSTFLNNEAVGNGTNEAWGGAIFTGTTGIATVVNSTFYGNKVYGTSDPVLYRNRGGAISNEDGLLTVINSTFARNEAQNGTAIHLQASTLGDPPIADLYNNVFYNHLTSPTCGYVRKTDIPMPSVTDHGGNLNYEAGTQSCPTSFDSFADPRLTAPAYNGGSTPTMALNAGSPAIGLAVSNCGSFTCPTTDQRGVARSDAEAGAYEVTDSAVTITSGTNPSVYGNNVTFTATIAPVSEGTTVTFSYGTTSLGTDATDASGVATFTTNDLPVGVWPVTASFVGDVSVPGASGSVNQTVNQRPITVTPVADSKVYGDADPASYAYNITAGSLVTGDTLTGALARTAGENVGDYPILIGTLANANYIITVAPVNFTITARPITITADAKTKVYGDDDPAFTYELTAGALVGTDAVTGALAREAGQNVGTYEIQQGSVTAGANYTITYEPADLTITKKELTVTADDITKVILAPVPPLTYTFTGFAYDDTADDLTGVPDLSTTAQQSSVLGDYPITIEIGSLASDNYTFKLVNGTLTVSEFLKFFLPLLGKGA